MTRALKAYSVLEHDENTGGIVFAKTNGAARSIGSGQFADGDFHSVYARRTPWADAFVDTGNVPASIAIAHGWSFECWCGAMVDEDALQEKGLPIDGAIGTVNGGTVYCSQACKDAAAEDRRLRKIHELAMLATLAELVLCRFPDAKILGDKSYAYAERRDEAFIVDSARVWFEFPGMKHAPATIELMRKYCIVGPLVPEFHCCNGDREAFEAWAKEQKTKRAQP